MRACRPIFLLLLFTGLFGCAATAAPSDPSSSPAAKQEKLPRPDADGRLTLAVGGQAEVAPGIVLTLESVAGDSRCAVDVNCIWAGEIRLVFALAAPHSDALILKFDLATTAPVAEVRGLEFQLLEAIPVPRSTVQIAAADYRISLHIGPAGNRQPKPGASS